MKIDWIKSVIVILINALIVYGMYSVCDFEALRGVLVGVAATALTITGLFTMGISVEGQRSAAILKLLSGIVYVLFLIIDWIFATIEFTIPLFIIVNGLLLLLYAVLAVSIARTKQ